MIVYMYVGWDGGMKAGHSWPGPSFAADALPHLSIPPSPHLTVALTPPVPSHSLHFTLSNGLPGSTQEAPCLCAWAQGTATHALKNSSKGLLEGVHSGCSAGERLEERRATR